jgi:S1-C subfamily serine protease
MTQSDDTPDAPRYEPPLDPIPTPPAPPRPWWDTAAPPEFTAPPAPEFAAPASTVPTPTVHPTPTAPQSWPAQPPSAWPPAAPPTWPPTTPTAGASGWGSGGGPGWTPPGTSPAPAAAPRRSTGTRIAAIIATVALVLASAGIGALVAVAVQPDTKAPEVARAQPRSPFTPNTANPTSPGSSNPNQRTFDPDAIADEVIPAIVNITTSTQRGRAAGTGIVISSDGLVLTNNHVIADSESISVDIGGTGNVKSAEVLGYNVADDVALLKINDVSDLETAKLGDASTVNVGDDVVAIGNALGQGGRPKVHPGNVTALGQQVTAGDPSGSGLTETLYNMIQTDTAIQPGDSGGALVNFDGEVVGVNTAASAGNGFRQQTGASVGFAIRIDDAMAIVEQIKNGQGSDEIHIGGHRALLGIVVDDAAGSVAPVSSGALVGNVQEGSAASDAGIVAGDVVIALDGKEITGKKALHSALIPYQPGQQVSIDWVDAQGTRHTATVTLGEGPPA